MPDPQNPFENPEVLATFLQLQSALDPERELRFRVPASIDRAMRAVQATANEERPQPLLRPLWDPARWASWRTRFQNALQHVADGLAAAHYHRVQLVRAERRIEEMVGDNADLLGGITAIEHGFTIAPRCRPLAFEYQAFLFAERRTLEYVAVAVARYFDRECHRIKGLAKAIAGQSPQEPRQRIELRLERDLGAFGLSDSEGRDARDRLAHWEAVDAGVLNIFVLPDRRVRVFLLGGEERLETPGDFEGGPALGVAVGRRVTRLAGFVFGCFEDLGLVSHEIASAATQTSPDGDPE